MTRQEDQKHIFNFVWPYMKKMLQLQNVLAITAKSIVSGGCTPDLCIKDLLLNFSSPTFEYVPTLLSIEQSCHV